MNNDPFTHKIRELISQGNTNKAIKEIELLTQTKLTRNTLTVLKARWEEVKRKEIIGAISSEDLLIEKAKINDSVLSFLEETQTHSSQEKGSKGFPPSKRKYLVAGVILLFVLASMIFRGWYSQASKADEHSTTQELSASKTPTQPEVFPQEEEFPKEQKKSIILSIDSPNRSDQAYEIKYRLKNLPKSFNVDIEVEADAKKFEHIQDLFDFDSLSVSIAIVHYHTFREGKKVRDREKERARYMKAQKEFRIFLQRAWMISQTTKFIIHSRSFSTSHSNEAWKQALLDNIMKGDNEQILPQKELEKMIDNVYSISAKVEATFLDRLYNLVKEKLAIEE
ncbi:MAG: hypothetical protein AAF696_22215 [Bacteroidota bacterium]